MVKLSYLGFRVTNSELKNKKFFFELLTRWVHFLFSHFRVTNMKFGKLKKFLNYWSSNDLDCVILLNFLYLASIIVSTYAIFVWVCWSSITYLLARLLHAGLMAYSSSITYLLARLPHAGLYNWRQTELFHMKWFNCG